MFYDMTISMSGIVGGEFGLLVAWYLVVFSKIDAQL